MTTLIDNFAAYARDERGLMPRTIEDYVRTLRAFDAFIATEVDGGPVALGCVTKQALTAFLRSQGSRFNACHTALNRFYAHLKRTEVISLNPVELVERQRGKKGRRRKPKLPLSFQEFITVVDTIETRAPPVYRARNVAIWHTGLHCGFRASEIASLRKAGVDLQNHAFLDVVTKGDKQEPTTFDDILAEVLEGYLDDPLRPEPANGVTALFLTKDGAPMGVRAIQRMVKHYAAIAGLSRPVTPHILRHSYANGLRHAGVDIRVIQKRLRHEDIRTTQEYLHVGDEETKQAVESFAAEFRKQRKALRSAEAAVIT